MKLVQYKSNTNQIYTIDVDSKPLGEGTFGKVYDTYHNGEKVVIKILKSGKDFDPVEIANLRHLRKRCGKFCLQLLDIGPNFLILNNLGMLFTDYLKRSQKKRLDEAPVVLAGLVNCIKNFHEFGLLHQDIKPDNLMIDGKGSVKLIDLGLSCMFKKPKNAKLAECGTVGTPNYNPPEFFMSATEITVDTPPISVAEMPLVVYIAKDIWGIACCMLEDVIVTLPQQLFHSFHLTVGLLDRVPDTYKNMLIGMLDRNPYQRVRNFEQVLQYLYNGTPLPKFPNTLYDYSITSGLVEAVKKDHANGDKKFKQTEKFNQTFNYFENIFKRFGASEDSSDPYELIPDRLELD